MKSQLSIKKTGSRGSKRSSLPISTSEDPQTISLLTDFGTSDYFVGSLKAVILGVNPHVRLVDITHEIPPQGIETAAFTLLASYRSFPVHTIHVAVVDPGVGSARRALLVVAGDQFFVGPDNGIFSYIYDAEPDHEVVEIRNDAYFRHPVSHTFHGRDIFAPVAAALSRGISPAELGLPIKDFVRLPTLAPRQKKNGTFVGRVLHIDRFGNCITSFSAELIPQDQEKIEIAVGDVKITEVRPFFGSRSKGKQKLFGIWGSAGFLEIAAHERSAARILKAKIGDSVTLNLAGKLRSPAG